MSERIAILTTSYPAHEGDAAGHFVASEARSLARAGHQVTVFAPGSGSPADAEVELVRIPDGGACGWPGLAARLRERPLRSLGALRWAEQSRRELSRRGPFERVICHWLLPCAFPVALGSRLRSARLEVVVHGSDARLLASLGKPCARAIMALLLRRNAHFRCVSSELSELIEHCAGRPLGSRIYVLPTLLELGNCPSRSSARERLGVESSAPLVVLVGRLVPGKRMHEALQAASLVAGITVVVVGDGPEASALKRLFPTVRFVGRLARNEALCWLAAADAVLSASRHEGAPTALREARALGVPVVATAAGDLTHWAKNDPGLWVVP